MRIQSITSGYNYNNKYNQQNKTINFEAKGLYAGSFDPITNGHLDVIKRASNMFDTLTILVGKNPKKEGFLPVETRVSLIKNVIEQEKLKNVKVSSSEGFTVDFAKTEGDTFMVRGIRNGNDLEDEMQLYKVNRKLCPDVDTVFLPTNPDTEIISSTLVRQIYGMNGNLSNFVPKPVLDYLANLKK